ncbi:MAG: hypothetical protein EPO21_13105 [Chloroflexota bacterium]|nr:MAG: hypothetical protein EPO21_13105 [Chloroflexota bacterium]
MQGREQSLFAYGLVLAGVGLGLYALHRHNAVRKRRAEALPPRRNPARRRTALTEEERDQLEQARALSREFHGIEDVIELDPRERQLPRFLVAMGAMPELEYEPLASSKRGHVRWVHESGDRGPLSKRSRAKPLLTVDPRTRRPVIVPMRSSMVLDPERGLVG